MARSEPTDVDVVVGRAISGVGLDVMRSITVASLGAAVIIVLARLLTPDDFGVIAFGTTVMAFAAAISQGGLGATLIRRLEPPSVDDLGVVVVLQLALGLAVLAVVLAASVPFGTPGYVTAALVAPLPLLAFRIPGLVVLERQLRYGAIALLEIAEHVVYAVVAVAAAVLGWGVWSFAAAGVARGVVSAALMVLVGPVGLVTPRWSGATARRLLAFGVRVQGVSLVQLTREQFLNIGTVLIAGVATLGVWTVATRLLQVPLLLYSSLWRVSFPGMARLVASDVEMGPLLARAAGVTAAGAGLLLAPLVGLAPALIPLVFGDEWSSALWVMPVGGAALLIGGPISVALTGYLWAAGDSRTPLRANTVAAVVWVGVALPLLGPIGVAALGIGWLAATLADATVLVRGAAALSNERLTIVRPLLGPACAAAAAATVGWLLAREHTTAGAVVGEFGLVVLLYLALLFLLDRARASELRATAARLARTAATLRRRSAV